MHNLFTTNNTGKVSGNRINDNLNQFVYFRRKISRKILGKVFNRVDKYWIGESEFEYHARIATN